VENMLALQNHTLVPFSKKVLTDDTILLVKSDFPGSKLDLSYVLFQYKNIEAFGIGVSEIHISAYIA
jgi:hypothetical protein